MRICPLQIFLNGVECPKFENEEGSMGRIAKISLVVVLLIGFIGCSATTTRRSFKESWKDSVTSTKVKYKLTADKLVKKRNLDVDVWRGVVTLTGRVTSPEEKERAEQLAWQVKGVRGVDNFLKQVGSAAETDSAVAMKGSTKTKIKTKAKVEETDIEDVAKVEVKETTKVTPKKIVEKEEMIVEEDALNRPVTPKTKAKVTETVEFEKPVKKAPVETTAKRESFSRPNTTDLNNKDLTTEESLAKEAAEELKKLRGEEDLAE